jgi:hypothetical protein
LGWDHVLLEPVRRGGRSRAEGRGVLTYLVRATEGRRAAPSRTGRGGGGRRYSCVCCSQIQSRTFLWEQTPHRPLLPPHVRIAFVPKNPCFRPITTDMAACCHVSRKWCSHRNGQPALSIAADRRKAGERFRSMARMQTAAMKLKRMVALPSGRETKFKCKASQQNNWLGS